MQKYSDKPPCNLQDLGFLNTFRSCLNESDIEKVVAWRNAIVAKDKGEPTKAKTAAPQKKTQTKKQVKNDNDLHEAALSFLKLPGRA
eukprot:3796121-Amphidinium_carterae.2